MKFPLETNSCQNCSLAYQRGYWHGIVYTLVCVFIGAFINGAIIGLWEYLATH